jgi:hypothetical protein
MTKALGRPGAALALAVVLAAGLAACVPMAPVQKPAQQLAQAPVQAAPEEAQTVTVIVGPALADCTGVGPQKCYQVKAHPEDEYRLFYSQIRGFEHEPGYEYVITVRVEPVANPPADASAYSYTLVEVISKTPVAVAATEPPATATPSDWGTVLKNIEYRSLFTRSGVAPLKDGEFRESTEVGSASETVVLLTDHVATGDLDGDGALDAAVVVSTNTGGSGVFMDLAAVLMVDGKPVNVAIAPLGDRVQIKSLAIRDGGILVDMITHDSDDPMCCPTQPVVEKYELRGERLEKKG